MPIEQMIATVLQAKEDANDALELCLNENPVHPRNEAKRRNLKESNKLQLAGLVALEKYLQEQQNE